MISDAFAFAACDYAGCREEAQVELTALASYEAYDMRNVRADLRRMGWRRASRSGFNELWYCPEHADQSPEPDDEDEE